MTAANPASANRLWVMSEVTTGGHARSHVWCLDRSMLVPEDVNREVARLS
jgi:hypothetical protein